MTTDELLDAYDFGYDHGYDGHDNMAGLDHRHLLGLEAVAAAAVAECRGKQDGKLSPQMIGRVITIKWSHGTTQAVTGKLAAYTEVEDYGFRLWFKGTHPEGYLVTDDLNITVHGVGA